MSPSGQPTSDGLASTGTPDASTVALATEAWAKLHEIFMSKRRDFVDIAAESGLTPGDMHALLSLTPSDPQPMRALADGWRCDASNVTWQVDRLEERGLTTRATSATDRRVKTVTLTSAGERVQGEIRAKLHFPPAELLELSDDVLEDLVRILAKVPTPEF